jgi:hypothetical protein
MLLASLGAYKSVPRQSQVSAHSVALPNFGFSNKLHLHLPFPFSIDWNFVGFLNTSYKFSVLVFEFTKTRDVPGTDFLPGHVSESRDCPGETGMSGNPTVVVEHEGSTPLILKLSLDMIWRQLHPP